MARKLNPANPPRLSILSDPDVNRWYNNLVQGSQVTADVFVRRLGAVCDRIGTTPKELVSMSEEKRYNTLLDFVSSQQKEGYAGTYIAHSLVAVRSWLSHHGIRINRKIKIRGAYSNPTIADERVPTQEELKRVLMGAHPRDRVAVVLMAHSGLRPEVLGNYLGNDGLRVKDFPDIVIRGHHVKFEKVPAMVVVRADLSKAGHRYFTFLGEEGCNYLAAYLEERIEAGAKLTPDSDVIAPVWADKMFVRTINIGDIVREAIRGAGYKWRPYVLRAYFDTQLLLAESRGKVAHDYRVFWMGHKGSMEAKYTTNKGRLPQEMIEDMRSAYLRCEPLLSTMPSKSATETQANIAKVMLMGMGYTDEELAGVNFDELDVATFQGLVQQKMAPPEPTEKPKQKVVGSKELSGFLSEGWTVVAAVGPDQVVLNPP